MVIVNNPQLESLREKYLAHGMPWDDKMNTAIKKATSGISDPALKDVTDTVITLLEQELERCVMEKGLNLLGKLWLRIKNRFFKNKTKTTSDDRTNEILG